jgi:DNA adenine methylase
MVKIMLSMKSLKSPLRYPGGKTKALKSLDIWFPEYKELREPFLGGGSVSLHLTKKYPNKPVWVNDLYYPLYNFWTILRDAGEELSDSILAVKNSMNGSDEAHKELFKQIKEDIKTQDLMDAAISFYILNKCSYSGLTENSTFSVTASRQNFTHSNIAKLKGYSQIIKRWKITNKDYSDVILTPGEDVFVFLDPPDDIKDFLYGRNKDMHKGFSHERFADIVDNCEHKFMVTYNVNDWITERYSKYHQQHWQLRYSLYHRKDNLKTELLVTNFPTTSSLESLL